MKFSIFVLSTLIGFTAFASSATEAIYNENTEAFEQIRSNNEQGIPELLQIVAKNLSVRYVTPDCNLIIRNDYGKAMALTENYRFQIKATITTDDFEAYTSIQGRKAAKIQGNRMILKANQVFPPTYLKMTFIMSNDGESFQVKTTGVGPFGGTTNKTCTFETQGYKIY
ncbi:MAG: hypothetical protein ACKOX6_08810 [Bdellovibrio sp.]